MPLRHMAISQHHVGLRRQHALPVTLQTLNLDFFSKLASEVTTISILPQNISSNIIKFKSTRPKRRTKLRKYIELQTKESSLQLQNNIQYKVLNTLILFKAHYALGHVNQTYLARCQNLIETFKSMKQAQQKEELRLQCSISRIQHFMFKINLQLTFKFPQFS